MTHARDIERVLEHWLDDGIDQMPDRVYLSILDRVERQPQQRAWRVSWRDSHVNAYLKPLAAIAAVIFVAVAGIAIFNGQRGDTVGGPTTAPSASPSPSPAPSVAPAATPAWDTGGQCGAAGCAGPLAAGTYTSRSLKPAVTYTLTTPWVNLRDWPEFFILYPDNPDNRALAADGKYAPYILIMPSPFTVLPSAQCAGGSDSDVVEMDAAKFAEYIATVENVAATGPVPVTIGGLTGQRIDVAPEPSWTGCLPAAPLGEKDTGSERYRFIVLDRPGDPSVMIRIRSLADHDAFFAEAMPIVESIDFETAQ